MNISYNKNEVKLLTIVKKYSIIDLTRKYYVALGWCD